MKAAIRRRYGPPGDVVELADVERPTPGDDEVLVRSARRRSIARTSTASGRGPFVRLFIGLRAPRDPRLGLDVAGVVEAVGAGVTRFKPGDRVFADLFPFGGGAFAEYVVRPGAGVPADPGRAVASRTRPPCPTRRSSRSRGSGAAMGGPSGPATRS